MRKKVLFQLFIILISLTWALQGYSLEKATHEAINQKVAQSTINGFSLNNYLKNNLGFGNGTNEPLYGYSEKKKKYGEQKMWEWLGEGGWMEDVPPENEKSWEGLKIPYNNQGRANNHFHNPLKGWDQAGLNDTFLGKTYTGQSSVLWSQNPNQNIGGNWSWQDARDLFYQALTSPDKTTREQNFADTFRAVGQLMHLVEDASVPAHVRNDIHTPNPMYPHYEQKVEEFRTKQNIYGSFWNDLLANSITFDKSILDIASGHPSASVPISRIIDTDLYNGDNPNATTTVFGSPQYIGIAEYTNANFMSKDTLFTHLEFNYPNISDTVLWTDNNNREYVKKVGSGDTINHLAITSWLYPFRITYFPQYTEYLPVGLDEECYEDYASKLIPRAVGYSAGLLNYFFRGKINIVQTGTDTFQTVNLSDEDMEGDLNSFKLYYDDINDDRIEISLAFFDEFGAQYTDPNTVLSIPAQSKSLFTVELQGTPQNPKNPGEYMLVFKGKLGNEGVAPYDTSYAVAAQLITQHFVIHVEVNGQWDVYEYDLLGNRIYNVTGGLERGIAHHHGIPNPVNPDKIVFTSEKICPGNNPDYQECVRIRTKSTGGLEFAEWIRVPFWSKDGQKIYGADGGYYDLSTGNFNPISYWDIDDTICGYLSRQSPSLSPDGSMLAAEVAEPSTNPDIVDIIVFVLGSTIYDPPIPTDVIDMNSMTLAPTDAATICGNYLDDEIFFDMTPDFHPSANEIVFDSDAGGPFDIYYTDFQSRNIQKLTNASGGDFGYYDASWSPDGQMILMTGEKQGETPEIYIMPATGGTPEKITEEGVKHYSPRWIKYLGQ